MARRRKGELSRYRLHKQSGQAVVSLPLGGGKYPDFLLGPFDSEESKREYTRVINEWLAAGMLSPPNTSQVGGRYIKVLMSCRRTRRMCSPDCRRKRSTNPRR